MSTAPMNLGPVVSNAPFTVNIPLWRSARWSGAVVEDLPSTRTAPLARDVVVGILAGVFAALIAHGVELNLRISGHAILKSVLPVTLGLALAPRRMTGMLIGAGTVAGSFLARAGGLASIGVGASTSLLLLGPCLDAALWRTSPGRGVVLRCAVAGLATNLGAFAMRGGKKLAGWDGLGMKPLSAWLTWAPLTYAACGLIAGLLAGLICFRWSIGPGTAIETTTGRRDSQ